MPNIPILGLNEVLTFKEEYSEGEDNVAKILLLKLQELLQLQFQNINELKILNSEKQENKSNCSFDVDDKNCRAILGIK